MSVLFFNLEISCQLAESGFLHLLLKQAAFKMKSCENIRPDLVLLVFLFLKSLTCVKIREIKSRALGVITPDGAWCVTNESFFTLGQV